MALNESLQAAIEDVQGTIGALTGITAAPDHPPGSPPGTWPFSIAFPRRGQFTGGGSGSVQLQGIHTIVVQLHYPRKNQEQAYEQIVTYLEPIVEAITDDPTLGGTVTTISGEIAYTFGGMVYAGLETIGWEFEIPVKIRYTAAS